MDKRRLHPSLGFIKVDLEAKVRIDNRLFCPIIGPSAEIGIETEEITIIETTIGPTIEIGLETTIGVTIGETTTGPMKGEIITGKTIGGETVTDKTIETDKFIEEMTPKKIQG